MVKMVRDICDTPPEADGLIQGNLKIAEDRILSYLLVLCQTTDQSGRTREWNTQWVPSTTFYFEAVSWSYSTRGSGTPACTLTRASLTCVRIHAPPRRSQIGT